MLIMLPSGDSLYLTKDGAFRLPADLPSIHNLDDALMLAQIAQAMAKHNPQVKEV